MSHAMTAGWARAGSAYAEMCWASTDLPHRRPTLDALEEFVPFASVLEVGCNSGVNLRLIHQRWPHVALAGLDVSHAAMDHLSASGLPVTLHEADVRDLEGCGAARADVILSVYTLAYLTPEELPRMCAALRRHAKRGLVLAEPTVIGASRDLDLRGHHMYGHDYAAQFPGDVRTLRWFQPAIDLLESVMTVRW